MFFFFFYSLYKSIKIFVSETVCNVYIYRTYNYKILNIYNCNYKILNNDFMLTQALS